jgi:hypothetical protein
MIAELEKNLRASERPEQPRQRPKELTKKEHAETLRTVAELLEAGLVTQVEPFPETEKEFGAIINQLRALDSDDVERKLVIGGFLDRPYGPDKLRCMECINFLVNRKWCDLPELALPVEPSWFCRLWRI